MSYVPSNVCPLCAARLSEPFDKVLARSLDTLREQLVERDAELIDASVSAVVDEINGAVSHIAARLEVASAKTELDRATNAMRECIERQRAEWDELEKRVQRRRRLWGCILVSLTLAVFSFFVSYGFTQGWWSL